MVASLQPSSLQPSIATQPNSCDIDVAENGDIHVAVEVEDPSSGYFDHTINRVYADLSAETAYEIGSVSGEDSQLISPHICVGFGGNVHVTWQAGSRSHTAPSIIAYRRNSSSGGGGLSYWDLPMYLSPPPMTITKQAPGWPVNTGATLFGYDLPVRAQVRLDVYDLCGYRIRSVFKEEVPAGSHLIDGDGRNESGHTVAGGMYFAQLQVHGPGLNRQLTRKVVLLR